MSMQQTKVEVRRLDMTMTVLSAEPEGAKLYKNYGALQTALRRGALTASVAGRMYLLESREDVLNKADAAKKTYTAQVDEYMVRRERGVTGTLV
jgi:hypothetical protein